MEEILTYFTGLLENTLTAGGDLNKIKDQQSSITLSIHYALNKLIKTVNPQIAEKVYLSIIGTFKSRGSCYDEGILAISSLALSNLLK